MIQETIEFRCPDCEGNWFTTDYAVKDGKIVRETMVGRCNSPDESGNMGCGFEWPRDDDWKHWVEVRRFETEAEFKDAYGPEEG